MCARATEGVTHEFLCVGSGETSNLDDISFLDHATGSNREDKYKRDLRLLTEALATERDPVMIARTYSMSPIRCGMPASGGRAPHVSPASKPRQLAAGVFMSLLSAAMLKEASATSMKT